MAKALLRFLKEIIFSLYDIVNKYALETKFCSIYEISSYTGIIVIVLFGFFSLFDYLFFKMFSYLHNNQAQYKAKNKIIIQIRQSKERMQQIFKR